MMLKQHWSYKRIAAGIVLAAAVAAAYAQNPARDRSGIGSSKSYEEYLQGDEARVSELVEMQVHGANGDAIGEIEDVLLDKGSELSLIVSVGGLLDIGDKLIARPLEDFRIAANGSELYLDITDQQLSAEPSYSHAGHVDEQAPSAAGPSAHAGMLGERIGGLLGATVVDESGREVGKIDDLLVPLDREDETRAVLAIGGIVGIGAKLVAVPFADIEVADRDGADTERRIAEPQVRLNMRADAVERMPPFEYTEREQRTAAL